MAAFTINISSPIAAADFTIGRGGPNSGGHQPPHWYIQYGMDLGADAGTEVHAAFDAHITRFTPHTPSSDTGKVYGAQLFMRSPNDMMGGFYTHITDVPSGLSVGSQVSRGDLLGKVYSFAGIPPHLHLALVEIIGGRLADATWEWTFIPCFWTWQAIKPGRLGLSLSTRTVRRPLSPETTVFSWAGVSAALTSGRMLRRLCSGPGTSLAMKSGPRVGTLSASAWRMASW